MKYIISYENNFKNIDKIDVKKLTFKKIDLYFNYMHNNSKIKI